MDRWELEKKLAIRALKDPEFKKKLMSSPKEAVKECMKAAKGFDAASLEKLHIHVHQEKQNEYHISIPYVKESLQKLSDKEIENLYAAGGSGGLTCHYFMGQCV